MFRRIASLRALQHRAYATLWLGSFVSNIGNWMQTIALGVYVTETTGRAGWTGTVAALMYLPALVFGPLGGAIADRVDRRRYLFVGTLAQAALAALLAGLAFGDRLTVPIVALVAMVSGCVAAMLSPAFNALLVEIVPREDLLSAVSLNSAQYNLGRIIGPVCTAAAMVWGGVGTALAANAVSFLAGLAAIALMPRSKVAHGPPEPVWAGIRRGVVAANGDPGIRTALLLTLAVGVLVAPFIGLVPVMAIKLLGGGAPETSLLVACQGVGAVLAAVVGGTIAERIGRRTLLRIAVPSAAVLALAYWRASGLHVAAAIIFCLGGAYLTALAGLNTVVQSRAPSALQARIASLYSMLLGGGYAIGLVVMGFLADRFGMRLVGVAGAAACLLVIGAIRGLRPAWLTALEASTVGAPRPAEPSLEPRSD
jgi:MFS family permease